MRAADKFVWAEDDIEIDDELAVTLAAEDTLTALLGAVAAQVDALDRGGDVINLPLATQVSFPTLVGGVQPTKPNRRPAPKGKRRKVQWRGLSLSRVPTAWEAEVLDLHAIVETYAADTDHLVLMLSEVRQASLVAAQDLLPATAVLPCPSCGGSGVRGEAPCRVCGATGTAPDATLPALAAAQEAMAAFGAAQVRDELRRQGARIPEPVEVGPVAVAPHLQDSIALAATTLSHDWQATLQRQAHRARRTKRRSLQADWVATCTAQVGWGLKTAARHLLHEALATGRRDEATRLSALYRTPDHGGIIRAGVFTLKRGDDEEDDGGDLIDYVVQTAVLDDNCCQPCEDVDGTVFEYGSDEQQEAEPPYFQCLGGDFCRCLQLFVVSDWRDRAHVDEDADRVVTQKQAEKIIKQRAKDDPYPKDDEPDPPRVRDTYPADDEDEED